MPLTPPTPLERPRRVDAVKAFHAGQAARAAGKAVTAIPFNVEAVTNPREQWRVMAWIRGWRTPIV